jgi:hypothetical protein
MDDFSTADSEQTNDKISLTRCEEACIQTRAVDQNIRTSQVKRFREQISLQSLYDDSHILFGRLLYPKI